MKLNNGIHIVDTDKATQMAETDYHVSGDGYSHETHKKFRLYKTVGGNFFITMEYIDHISGWVKPVIGTQLVDVYKTPEEARVAAEHWNFVVPEELMVQVE